MGAQPALGLEGAAAGAGADGLSTASARSLRARVGPQLHAREGDRRRRHRLSSARSTSRARARPTPRTCPRSPTPRWPSGWRTGSTGCGTANRRYRVARPRTASPTSRRRRARGADLRPQRVLPPRPARRAPRADRPARPGRPRAGRRLRGRRRAAAGGAAHRADRRGGRVDLAAGMVAHAPRPKRPGSPRSAPRSSTGLAPLSTTGPSTRCWPPSPSGRSPTPSSAPREEMHGVLFRRTGTIGIAQWDDSSTTSGCGRAS